MTPIWVPSFRAGQIAKLPSAEASNGPNARPRIYTLHKGSSENSLELSAN